jgi:outer membrane protein assembly factor BamD
MPLFRLLTTCCLALLITACASKDELPNLGPDAGERQMYNEAQRYLGNRNYQTAVRALQLLESRYPFGRYAEQAQLEIIYAYHGAFEHEAAIEAAERFIRLHPQHPSIDYAYYMKGLAGYAREQDMFDRFMRADPTRKDISYARTSFSDFAQLLARFPDSPYAADARARMVHLRNQLARHEIHVANYYFKRGAYLAAANRGRYVVENFQRSTAVPDGLAVMVQAYILLGLEDLAQSTQEVLALNYPQHPAVGPNGEFAGEYTSSDDVRSFLNRVSFGLLDPPRPPEFDSRRLFE